MLESLARYWWMVALRGAVAVLFGLVALIWPDVTLLALIVLFGAYALVDGVFALFAAFGPNAEGRRFWLAVQGIAGIAIGVITFAWPGVTTLVLLALIAAWAIVTGILQIIAAIRLRREMRNEWLLALGGVLSVLVGILLAVWPSSGALALVLLIGAYAVVFGVVLIALGLRLRRQGGPSSAPTGQAPAT
ncbi:MAG TPA: HdeD family acid-resistance protein [Micromonosporaceae bacterium]